MLHDILLSQKRELALWQEKRFVPRTSVFDPPSADLARVILGPRRAGKSSWALHLARREGNFGYVNFDDERLARLVPDAAESDPLMTALDAVYGQPGLIFFDEIQNLPGWELLANRLQRMGRRLILTGSNAHLLSTELSTHLTGRHVALPLFPFSFSEFLAAKGAGQTTQSERVALCRVYAQEGGFPETALKSLDSGDYLRTLLQSILLKDIVGRHRVRGVRVLEDLVARLLSGIGSEYSLSRIAEMPGQGSVHMVRKYIGYLEEAFIMFSVPRFSWKVREQVASNKKAYAVDTGLASAAGFRFSANTGRLYENLVAIACRRRQARGQCELYFWKNAQGEEVDFVLKTGRAVEALIQVCADASEPRARQREMRALLKASRDLRCDNLLLLTETEEREENFAWHGLAGKITLVPLWRWLLEND